MKHADGPGFPLITNFTQAYSSKKSRKNLQYFGEGEEVNYLQVLSKRTPLLTDLLYGIRLN